MRCLTIPFRSQMEAIQFANEAKKQDIPGCVMPTSRRLTISCSYCFMVERYDELPNCLDKIKSILANNPDWKENKIIFL